MKNYYFELWLIEDRVYIGAVSSSRLWELAKDYRDDPLVFSQKCKHIHLHIKDCYELTNEEIRGNVVRYLAAIYDHPHRLAKRDNQAEATQPNMGNEQHDSSRRKQRKLSPFKG